MCDRCNSTLLRKICFKGEEQAMTEDVALWIASLFLIVPALLYAYIAVKDANKKEKKS